MFESITINADVRDQRFLSGGNFFGTEAVGPPPRDPNDLPPPPEPAVPAGGAAAAKGGAPNAPPLMLKLPSRSGGSKKAPDAPTS